MDRQSVFSLSVLPPDVSSDEHNRASKVQQQLVDFILNFHLDNVFLYR